jgi:hypothetical protein
MLGVASGFLLNALIGSVLAEDASQITGQPQLLDWIGQALFFALASFYWGSIFGVPAMLMVGLPLHALLRRFGVSALPWYAGVGPIVGLGAYLLAAMTVQALWPIANPEVLYETYSIRGTLLIGLSTAVVFWLIRRPDRDTRSNPPTPPS